MDVISWSSALPLQRMFSFYVREPAGFLFGGPGEGAFCDYYDNLLSSEKRDSFFEELNGLDLCRRLRCAIRWVNGCGYQTVDIAADSFEDAAKTLSLLTSYFYDVAKNHAKSERALRKYGTLRFGFETCYCCPKFNTN